MNRWPPAIACLSCIFSLAVAAGTEETAAYFQKLIEAANVRFEYYDPQQQSYEHPAYTSFELKVRYRSTYQYTVSSGPRNSRVAIRPRIEQIEISLENRIRLPDHLADESRWNSPLVQHEFDHVAMTIDPRLRMLMEDIHRGVSLVERTAEQGTVVDDDWVGGAIAAELELRRQAVHEVLVANEARLDELTHHGRRPLENRRVFFQSLFQEKNLRENNFPYLSEVRSLLQTAAYQEAELPYRWNE